MDRFTETLYIERCQVGSDVHLQMLKIVLFLKITKKNLYIFHAYLLYDIINLSIINVYECEFSNSVNH